MGRDKRNEARGDHFTKMVRITMQTEAWRALSPTAQALYPWIKLEWRGPAANNNGKLKFSVRQAARAMGVGTNTAGRAFHDLQAKGFIVVTKPAHLGTAGKAQCPEFEVTEIGLPHSDTNTGRRLFKEWKIGVEFPIIKAPVNNPLGVGGRNKTPSPKWGQSVTVLKTVSK